MFFNKKISIYVLCSLTLFLGFIFGENSSGGAKIDHKYLFPFIENFSYSLETGLKNFLSNSGSLIHSPIFYLLISFLLKISNSLIFVSVFYLLLCLSLPLLFYQILKEKFKTDDIIIFYLSIIIFLSPYFRSSAIWLLGDNLSLIFFSASIIYFLKFEQDKEKRKFIYFSISFLVACCYIRYYYGIFYLYYLYYFFKNLDKKFLLKILLFSFFLSIPAFFYFYYIIEKFYFLETLNVFGNINYVSSGIIILSIIFFYLLPFIINKEFEILRYYKKNFRIIINFLFIFFIIYLINFFIINGLIDFPRRGGGIFIKLFRLFEINETIPMLFISCLSMIIIDFIFKEDRLMNYLLLLIIIISLPLISIYQKYLDPLFYLIFFGLVKSNYLENIILKNKLNIKFIFIYFFSFYIFSLLYYLK